MDRFQHMNVGSDPVNFGLVFLRMAACDREEIKVFQQGPRCY
jgi:hypothetical protein